MRLVVTQCEDCDERKKQILAEAIGFPQTPQGKKCPVQRLKVGGQELHGLSRSVHLVNAKGMVVGVPA